MPGSGWTRRALGPAMAGFAVAGRAMAQAAPPLPVPLPAPLPGSLPKPATPDAIRADIDPTDRMTVMVRINGQGPYPFVVDTGAERSAISAELAAELGLPAGPPMIVHGVAGFIEAASSMVSELAVGTRRLRQVSLPVLTRDNVGAAGVLGIDAVQGQRVLLDFRRRQILVETTPPLASSDDIVITAKSRFGQLVLVDSSFQHQPVLVVIDTGAQATIGNLALKRRIHTVNTGLVSNRTDIFSVTGQSTTGDWAIISEVQVGGFTLNQLPVVFSDLHSFGRWRLQDQPALLLGMDVLRQFETVQIDFGRREVRFHGLHVLSQPANPYASRLG